MANSQQDQSIHSALILAGGLGTRLRSAVRDVPKPMAPIHDRPFLEYLLAYWIGEGIRHFVLSVGYLNEHITRHFGHSYLGIPLTYAVEDSPLGTGGGALQAASNLPDDTPFLVLNGDTFFEVNLAQLSDFHHRKQADWTLALFQVADSTSRYTGISLDQEGRIVRMENAEEDGYANGGVYVMEKKVLSSGHWMPGHPFSLEQDVLPECLVVGTRVYGWPCKGRFIDIGIPDDYRRGNQFFEL
jgi:D-glycero-alpha-D-manno-heptose 1-phosphate guanylyltransferase